MYVYGIDHTSLIYVHVSQNLNLTWYAHFLYNNTSRCTGLSPSISKLVIYSLPAVLAHSWFNKIYCTVVKKYIFCISMKIKIDRLSPFLVTKNLSILLCHIRGNYAITKNKGFIPRVHKVCICSKRDPWEKICYKINTNTPKTDKKLYSVKSMRNLTKTRQCLVFIVHRVPEIIKRIWEKYSIMISDIIRIYKRSYV